MSSEWEASQISQRQPDRLGTLTACMVLASQIISVSVAAEQLNKIKKLRNISKKDKALLKSNSRRGWRERNVS